ncbi:MAG: aminotransferase class III-fold pyridoxal phosphate-dependent enzyme [Candidatus Aminicenantes bacterium]|nr:aminotransferase class III-fold pyridoxal phosphate-dependent enzyme [Candidatus Aminicenantes bacterium]
MDKESLLEDLIINYRTTHPKSEEFFRKASQFEIRGGSHNLRLFAPFPFYDVSAGGSKVTDIDGNTYVDFWQGHFGNIMGHNPPVVINALLDYIQKGQGLSTGFPGTFQKELAELICTRLQTDKIRFTTSGTLASMYAVMISRAYTQRNLLFKVGGGWHGAQPYTLKGISVYDGGLNQIESAGLPAGIDSTIIMTGFNDMEGLEENFRKYGEQSACLIVEPFIGAGGFIFGTPEYLSRARELCDKYGVVLIFDEVVSGFRFHAGAVQTLYGIKPDMTVLGKAIGGGMPVSALAGKDEFMALCRPDAEENKRVKFEGGTFCAHPASMLAGVTFIRHLIENENELYPRIGKLGAKVRREIEAIFNSHGFHVRCSGDGGDIAKNSSVVGVHFLDPRIDSVSTPEIVWNPEMSDFMMREKIFKLAMLEEGFNIFHGYGGISAAHTDEEIQSSIDAVERIAEKWKKYR